MNIDEMMKNHWQGVLAAAGILSLMMGYMIRLLIANWSRKSADNVAKKILHDAHAASEVMKKEARVESKEEIHKARADFEKEIRDRRTEVVNLEKRLLQKEENFEKKAEGVDKSYAELRNKEKLLKASEEELRKKQADLEGVLESERQQLQKISGLSREEAKRLLLAKIEQEIQHDAAAAVRQGESRIQEDLDKKARWAVIDALQRCAVEHVQEATVTTVSLPNDDIKGKIIGREGRNIRTFEAATGVDLIIDDTPETVVISGFDTVRREIARISLEQLIQDGRIHPARIEEVVERVRKDMEESIRQAGEEAVFELGLTTVHPDLVKLIGRLKYRTSYGQNVLSHSKEVAWLLSAMAPDLGLDVKIAKRTGLLHDIGKALSHEVEGTHASVGAELARKYHESEEVIQGIAGHHADSIEPTLWGVFTQVGDAISAGRPGARLDTVENYIQRLGKLEDIANGFKGIERSFAIQAGREIRVMVRPEEINEDAALLLSRDIAKKIQQELQYPGVIKVTVIRETRAVEFAR